MKKTILSRVLGGSALMMIIAAPNGEVSAQTTQPTPIVFQAAGPSVASIQSTVDQFRAALGDNLGSVPGGESETGRREINWDGGGTATSIVGTPFDGFLNSRGARMTTNGTGFVQAPVAGIADTFANPTYETAFTPFSQQRLFSAIGSSFTVVSFFVPGTNGDTPARTRAFGVVFTDVDRQSSGTLFFDATFRPGAQVEFYDISGRLLFFQFAPASPGNGGLSFLGVVFDDARIAFVQIRSGSVAPGPNDTPQNDMVMMDDFIFGEPQIIR